MDEDCVGLSVILPSFNEQENIQPLADELSSVLDRLGSTYEIIFVDDASTDRSVDRVRQAMRSNPRIRLVRHGVNSGQSASLMTGFDHARGKILITMDADMQNDPADIPRLLDELKTCDAVCGVRVNRRDTFIKRASSRIANRFRNLCLKDGLSDTGCPYRAFQREVLVHLIPFRGLHRFLPTLWKIHGFRVREIAVNHRPRLKGVSKYGVGNRLFVGIHDILGIRWYRKRRLPMNRVMEEETPKENRGGEQG